MITKPINLPQLAAEVISVMSEEGDISVAIRLVLEKQGIPEQGIIIADLRILVRRVLRQNPELAHYVEQARQQNQPVVA